MVSHNAFFVSDLHLFSQRSLANEHFEAICAHARRSHTFVLGGDIFDFRWSTHASLQHSLDAATDWLSDMVTSAPRCTFHMLLGNHDHHELLIDRLRALELDHDNLVWNPYFIRLGGSVFLHGDAVDGDATHQRLVQARGRDSQHGNKSAAANIAYDAVIQTRAHRAATVFAYPKRRTARRLLRYLSEVGHGADSGIQHVYFGHTHRALHAYKHAGVRFHNGGAPIRGVPFRIVPAEAPSKR